MWQNVFLNPTAEDTHDYHRVLTVESQDRREYNQETTYKTTRNHDTFMI